MCPECKHEYENPLDRRFHAQPNACPVCGPQIRYFDHQGAQVAKDAKLEETSAAGKDALERAAEAIRKGKIVAVKGLGGFHLMCDARDDTAVALLRERKPRPDRPFAVMAPNLAWVERHCEVSPEAAALLTSPEAPIVLLPQRLTPGFDDQDGVSRLVAPDNPTLGVMLPYTPLHHLLMAELGFPVVATSGNLSDEPICTDENDAIQRLGHIADGFLIHNRPIERHADDSIAWVVAGAPRLLRRARGYAPLPVRLKEEVPPVLAVGPHMKNTVSLSVGRQVFISQHIGDLETPEAFAAFERVIADFLRLYEVSPAAIAHDLHPDYASTRWAVEQGKFDVPLIAVQHHHAHLAACLAENQVEGPALGVSWDGTGYGMDGSIWGGEFLLGDAAGYERVAHLRPFALPGGDAAVHEPRRVALALLYELYGEAAFDLDLPPVRHYKEAERRLLVQMLKRKINTPVTTSMGRLFDGVASLAGLPQVVTFEGQAAIRLEHVADVSERGAYPLLIQTKRADGQPPFTPTLLDWEPLVQAVLEDVRRGVAAPVMAARFHNGLVLALIDVAHAVSQQPAVAPLMTDHRPRVALTGGCFQNRLLTERASEALAGAGFEVLLHRQTPPNDGCVSLGQVAIAAAQLRGDGVCV
jgi:hydrogenase maturation protein HypF